MDIAIKLQRERATRAPSCLDQFEFKPQIAAADPWIDGFIARLSALIGSIARRQSASAVRSAIG
jgi:hypothetical protein